MLSDRQATLFTRVILSVLMITGLGMGLTIVGNGLPESIQPEEEQLASRVAAMAENETWTLNDYTEAITVYPLIVIYSLGEEFLWTGSIAQMYNINPSELIYFGRLLSLLYWVLCIPLIYLVGKQLRSTAVGLSGVALFLTFPLPLQNAITLSQQTAILFWTLLIISLFLRLSNTENKKVRGAILIGGAVVTGIVIKYVGMPQLSFDNLIKTLVIDLPQETSLPLLALGLIGMLYGAVTRNRNSIILLTIFILLLLYPHQLLLLPLLALFAAYIVYGVIHTFILSTPAGHTSQTWLMFFATLLLCLPSAVKVIELIL